MVDRRALLKGKKVAIVATNGFEESELFEPKHALEDAGAVVEIISLRRGKIKAWKDDDWGKDIDVDKVVTQAYPEEYDALMLPGGVINADMLRDNKSVVEFVKDFAESGKPIAAICHAAWTLIETGFAKNHVVTSWHSLKTDLENAGAEWVDQAVVADQGWITSRGPKDLPAFNKKMIEEFYEGSYTESLSPSQY